MNALENCLFVKKILLYPGNRDITQATSAISSLEIPPERMQTRGSLKKQASVALVPQLEPKKIFEAIKDESWVKYMIEELN